MHSICMNSCLKMQSTRKSPLSVKQAYPNTPIGFESTSPINTKLILGANFPLKTEVFQVSQTIHLQL